MALRDWRCNDCGHLWEAIDNGVIADPDAVRCPSCKREHIESLPCAGVGKRLVSFADMGTAEDRAEALENKAWLESQAEQILSGEVEVAETTIPELRLQVPERLQKRYY